MFQNVFCFLSVTTFYQKKISFYSANISETSFPDSGEEAFQKTILVDPGTFRALEKADDYIQRLTTLKNNILESANSNADSKCTLPSNTEMQDEIDTFLTMSGKNVATESGEIDGLDQEILQFIGSVSSTTVIKNNVFWERKLMNFINFFFFLQGWNS